MVVTVTDWFEISLPFTSLILITTAGVIAAPAVVLVGGWVKVKLAGAPGTTVTVLPEESPLVTPVTVMVAVPARKPVRVLAVRVTEPVPLVWVQL